MLPPPVSEGATAQFRKALELASRPPELPTEHGRRWAPHEFHAFTPVDPFVFALHCATPARPAVARWRAWRAAIPAAAAALQRDVKGQFFSKPCLRFWLETDRPREPPGVPISEAAEWCAHVRAVLAGTPWAKCVGAWETVLAFCGDLERCADWLRDAAEAVLLARRSDCLVYAAPIRAPGHVSYLRRAPSRPQPAAPESERERCAQALARAEREAALALARKGDLEREITAIRDAIAEARSEIEAHEGAQGEQRGEMARERERWREQRARLEGASAAVYDGAIGLIRRVAAQRGVAIDDIPLGAAGDFEAFATEVGTRLKWLGE